MSEDLPSVASLRAFVSVAENRSFKKAAAAHHASPSTLSRQVQALEAQLGLPLLVRGNPGVALTKEGEQFLVSARSILRELREATEAVRSSVAGPLRISALESFCAKWLVPHLPKFHEKHPDIEIQLEATLRYANFDEDPVDLAIRFGTGPWEPLHSEPLLDLSFFPVCSPALRDGCPPIRRVEDLAEHTWIHVSQVPDAWSVWMKAAGHPALEPRATLSFDHVGIALSAAETGQGVVLSANTLCAAELESGRLCVPIDQSFESRSTYHLLCRLEGLEDSRIVAFRDWIVDELATDA